MVGTRGTRSEGPKGLFIPDMKTVASEVRNTTDKINHKLHVTKGKKSEFEDIATETIQNEAHRGEKRTEKKDLCDTRAHTKVVEGQEIYALRNTD